MRLYSLPIACLVAVLVSSAVAQDYGSSDPQDHGSPQPPRGEWLGWGADVYNNRWAAPGSPVDSSNAASLIETCSQTYVLGVSATAVVQHGVAYYPTWDGRYVALDYKNCKVIWEVNVTALALQYGPSPFKYVQAISRTSAALDDDVLYFGTQLHALLVAVDRKTGKVLSQIQMNSHPLAVITQSPTFWKGIVYVGCSSQEEAAAGLIPNYTCCSFIGNFAAVRFDKASKHFSMLWDQSTAPKDSGFQGIGVWGGQPSIDPNGHQVFIATGNAYSIPESAQKCQNQTNSDPGLKHDPCTPFNVYAEAVLAFDLTSGHINWVAALGPLDSWNVACLIAPGLLNPGNCPPTPGPDADFGMAPSFVPGSRSTPQGKDTVVVGQKNGNLYAFNAEGGALFWALPTSPDGLAGGLIWGLAIDDSTIYYTAVNAGQKPWRPKGSSANVTNSAFGAASLSDGTSLWQTVVPQNMLSESVPSVVNDVVFNGRTGIVGPGFSSVGGTGGLVALNKKTGAIIRDYDLENIFWGNVAIVDSYVMFGIGYALGKGNGTFKVWQAKD
jgi:outer membrane protein assembly factor BamB